MRAPEKAAPCTQAQLCRWHRTPLLLRHGHTQDGTLGPLQPRVHTPCEHTSSPTARPGSQRDASTRVQSLQGLPPQHTNCPGGGSPP